jgi:hypothetical protein
MAKQKKKRSKKYTGTDAAVTRPTVTRVKAVKRTKLQQWWLDRRRALKPALIAAAIISGVVWLVVELVRIASGGGY